MKIRYQFVNGEISETEVDEAWANELAELDRLEYNINQKETRRHCSLDGMDYEGEVFADDEDFVSDFLKRQDCEKLREAVAELLPQQQELVRKVFFEGQSYAQIARDDGVGESAVRDRLSRIFRKIEKSLK